MTAPATRRTKEALEYLYVGEVGDGIHRHGISHQDLATDISFRALTAALAPAGWAGEALFRNLYLVLEAVTAGTIEVTPLVDGKLYATQTFTVDGNNPERQTIEVPITQPHPASGERARAGVRGTWIQVLVEGKDTEGSDWDITIEGVDVEAEVVRETLPKRTFMPRPLSQVDRAVLDVLYMGEAGDGIWTMDLGLGAGIGTCLSGSPAGLCKLEEGLVKELDYSAGADRFEFGDVATGTPGWIVLSGTDPVDDPVNGWVDIEAGVIMVYYDPDLAETAEQMVMAEVFHVACDDVLPGVAMLLDAAAGDTDHYYVMQTWIVTCTENRMTLGERVLGTDTGFIPVGGGNAGNWWWVSGLVAPKGALNETYASDNDTNWILNDSNETDLFGRVGRPGFRAWQLGVFSPRDPTRLRRWRWHKNARTVVQNVPDGHQIVIERDAGTYPDSAPGATTETIQNTSGGPVDITFDAEGFPTPGVDKTIPPMSRIYITTNADPGTKIDELEEDVNWGSVYCYQCPSAVPPQVDYVLEPNEIAPAGPGGEALFHSLYLVVTRNNTSDVACEVVPILDDVELAAQSITLAAVPGTRPVTEVCEIPLHQPHGSPERTRHGLRGTWFRFRVQSDVYQDLGTRLIFDGAVVDARVVRESKSVGTAAPAPTVGDPLLLESGDFLLLENGTMALQES